MIFKRSTYMRNKVRIHFTFENETGIMHCCRFITKPCESITKIIFVFASCHYNHIVLVGISHFLSNVIIDEAGCLICI